MGVHYNETSLDIIQERGFVDRPEQRRKSKVEGKLQEEAIILSTSVEQSAANTDRSRGVEKSLSGMKCVETGGMSNG